MKLSELPKDPATRKKRRRVGRGLSQGQGRYSGKGRNGQKSRSGGAKPYPFAGGALPLYRRIPKIGGFVNPTRREYFPVNLDQIAALELPEGTRVNPGLLREKGLVSKRGARVKLLGRGEIVRPLSIAVHAVSESARVKVESAGGTVEIIAWQAEKSRKDNE
ncbi:MAG TPA: 50S ribosomal protein L15 [Firmicutes bacterium]|nr:50S ribosomal protein L15 [Bacillota bacterium]